MDAVRFVSFVSALSSLLQSTAWTILSLLAILSYTCSIKANVSSDFSDQIARTYFQGCDPIIEVAGLTPRSSIAAISSIYFCLSIAWFVSSAVWLYRLQMNNNDRMFHIWESAWIGVTIATSLFDLGVVITFGVDYGKSGGNSVTVALMSIAARGYILWILNTSAAIYLAFQVARPYKTHHEPHTLQPYPTPRHSQEILQRTYPHPWLVQSPTVGSEPRQPEPDYEVRSGVVYAKNLLRSEPRQSEQAYDARSGVVYAKNLLRSEPRQSEQAYDARPGVVYAKNLLRSEPRQSEQAYDARSGVVHAKNVLRREPGQPEHAYDARSGVVHAKDVLRREPPPLDEVPRRPALKSQPSTTSVVYELPGPARGRPLHRQASALSATFFQPARPAPFKLGPPRPPRRMRTLDE